MVCSSFLLGRVYPTLGPFHAKREGFIDLQRFMCLRVSFFMARTLVIEDGGIQK